MGTTEGSSSKLTALQAAKDGARPVRAGVAAGVPIRLPRYTVSSVPVDTGRPSQQTHTETQTRKAWIKKHAYLPGYTFVMLALVRGLVRARGSLYARACILLRVFMWNCNTFVEKTIKHHATATSQPAQSSPW